VIVELRIEFLHRLFTPVESGFNFPVISPLFGAFQEPLATSVPSIFRMRPGMNPQPLIGKALKG
jgi:hypothetical protein